MTLVCLLDFENKEAEVSKILDDLDRIPPIQTESYVSERGSIENKLASLQMTRFHVFDRMTPGSNRPLNRTFSELVFSQEWPQPDFQRRNAVLFLRDKRRSWGIWQAILQSPRLNLKQPQLLHAE